MAAHPRASGSRSTQLELPLPERVGSASTLRLFRGGNAGVQPLGGAAGGRVPGGSGGYFSGSLATLPRMVQAAVLVLFAHPYPDRSRANRRLLSAVQGLPGVAVRSLYDLYPGFDIDVSAEQSALRAARAIVWQHPLYWYSVPGLLKHWFDKVLARGFAYGPGGTELSSKRCLWVVTTGGDEQAYTPSGMHQRPFPEYTPVVEQTALFCGMRWEPPLVFHGAHRAAEQTLDEAADDYRRRVEQLLSGSREAS